MVLTDIGYLKKRYQRAVKNREDKFMILGFEVLTDYVGHLLNYFETRGLDDRTLLTSLFKKDGDDE